MAIFWLPFSLPEQLKAVHSLLKVPFLTHDEKMELERIENDLKFNIPLKMDEKEFLKILIKKFGSFA